MRQETDNPMCQSRRVIGSVLVAASPAGAIIRATCTDEACVSRKWLGFAALSITPIHAAIQGLSDAGCPHTAEALTESEGC